MVFASNLLREMQSFVSVPKSLITKAAETGINEANNQEFAEILEGWSSGLYDEDPDYVVSEIENLLN